MKTMLILVTLLVTLGCAPKFTIPDEPKYKEMYVFPMNGMVCFDREGMGVLEYNIKAQKAYADQMRKVLEDLKVK